MPINKSLSQFMDLARWFSALLVVITHVNNRMLPRLGELQQPTLLEYAWGFACGFAHQAVVVFFTLSGFLVGGKVLAELHSFNASQYLIARVARIYLVLVPVLLITAMLDTFGTWVMPEGVYSQLLKGNLNMQAFLGNLLNLQNMVVPPLGSNGPLGTLANEFWYYLTFPLLIAPLMSLPRAYGVVLCLAGSALLAVQTMLMPEHGAGFVLWLFGVACARLTTPRGTTSPGVALSIFVTLLVALRVGIRSEQIGFWTGVFLDIVVATSFCHVLHCLRVRPWTFQFPNWSKSVADFSYSLYAVHVPIIMVYCAVLVHFTGFGWHARATTAWQLFAVAGAVVLPIAAAYLLSRVTERHTADVRRWATAWLKQRRTLITAELDLQANQK